jgi:hypothetical protein
VQQMRWNQQRLDVVGLQKPKDLLMSFLLNCS